MMKLISLILILLFTTSCTFMYVPFIPANPQTREARLLMSESAGLSVETLSDEVVQLRLDITIKEIPESDWLAVQWFNPLSKEVGSESKWLEVPVVIEEDITETAQRLSFDLPADITLTPGYWRAVVSYQDRLIRQFGFDYVLVEESSNLNEETSSETKVEETPNESQ